MEKHEIAKVEKDAGIDGHNIDRLIHSAHDITAGGLEGFDERTRFGDIQPATVCMDVNSHSLYFLAKNRQCKPEFMAQNNPLKTFV
jgi:hypothetical protein